MHASRIDSTVVPQGTYQPYLYAKGLFQQYGTFHPRHPTGADGGAPVRDDFSQVGSTWIPLPGERVQTVEQIIAHGYFAVPWAGEEPEMALLSDKKHTAGMGLDDVIRMIRGRYELHAQNLYELALAQCEASNAVFRQEARQGFPANQRQWYSAEKRIQELYEQQRAERIELWRDVARIRATLPEIAQQYLAAYRKAALLEEEPGAGTGTPATPTDSISAATPSRDDAHSLDGGELQ